MTRYAYVCDLKMFCDFLVAEIPKFADKPVALLDEADFDRVTSRDIRAYLDYLGYYVKDDAERTNAELGKMRKLSSLRSFYEFLFKNEYVKSDVSKLVDMPKRHERPHHPPRDRRSRADARRRRERDGLSERQRRYNEHTKLRDLAILTLFLGTGIRVSELVGLNVGDIDFSINGFLITRKGGNQAILYFPDEVADVLRRYLAARKSAEARSGDEEALFLSLQNRRISVRAVQMMVKKYAQLAAPLKKHLSPHKLRSTFGTNLYHETGDIYLVADVLGHTDVNTTTLDRVFHVGRPTPARGPKSPASRRRAEAGMNYFASSLWRLISPVASSSQRLFSGLSACPLTLIHRMRCFCA